MSDGPSGDFVRWLAMRLLSTVGLVALCLLGLAVGGAIGFAAGEAVGIPILTFVGGICGLVSAGVVGLLVVRGMVRRWNERQLGRIDDLFEPLGLVGAPHTSTGRRYSGEVDGRQVEVWFQYLGGRLKLLQLEVQVRAPTDRVVSFTAPRLVTTEMAGTRPALRIEGADADWGREAATDPATIEPIEALVYGLDHGHAQVRTTAQGWVYWYRGVPVFGATHAELTPEHARTWIRLLGQIADRAAGPPGG